MTPSPGMLRLPLSVWSVITEQLDRSDQIKLGYVCKELRGLIVPKLYERAVLSEWNNEAVRFFQAIEAGIICQDVVASIQWLELQVLSREGCECIVEQFIKACGKLKFLETLCITCYWFEDAIAIVNRLGELGCCSLLFELRSRCTNSIGCSLQLKEATLSKISMIMAPNLYVSVLHKMDNLRELEVNYLVHGEEPEHHPEESANKRRRATGPLSLDRAHLSYADWVALGRPSVTCLDLELGPNYLYRQNASDVEKQHVSYTQVKISDASIRELKLIGVNQQHKQHDVGHTADIEVVGDSIQALMALNLDEFSVERLFTKQKCPDLKFVSVVPVSAGALRGLLTSAASPELCFALVTDLSYTFKTQEEVSRLVRWLQSAASQFPIDLRDLSGTIDREIIFGEGMWMNIQQTPYSALARRCVR